MTENLRKYESKDFMKSGEDVNVCLLHCKKENAIHIHDFVELVYVYKGSGTQTICNNTYNVKRGDMLFINHGQTHSFAPDGSGMTYINIMLNLNFVSEKLVNSDNAFEMLMLSAYDDIRDDVDTGLNMVSFADEELPEIESILLNCLNEYDNKQPAYKAVLRGYVGVILAKMIRKMSIGQTAESNDIWDEIREYISNNLNEKLSLGDLAQRCFYNPSYFSRIFKEKYGISLKDYVLKSRLERAAYLLKTTDTSADSIATMCGFKSKSSFYKAFDKHFGETPHSFRSKF